MNQSFIRLVIEKKRTRRYISITKVRSLQVDRLVQVIVPVAEIVDVNEHNGREGIVICIKVRMSISLYSSHLPL